jgi:hypothetical protein
MAEVAVIDVLLMTLWTAAPLSTQPLAHTFASLWRSVI